MISSAYFPEEIQDCVYMIYNAKMLPKTLNQLIFLIVPRINTTSKQQQNHYLTIKMLVGIFGKCIRETLM